MRLFEAILLLGDLLTFLLLIIPRARAAGWALSAGLFTVLAVAAHLLFEGVRWQMVPAYVLTGALVATALLLSRLSTPLIANTLGRRLVTGAAVVSGVIALSVATALPLMVPMFRLARPTGPYAIGTLTYDWVDQSRADWANKNARRELVVQVWYPAERTSHPKYDTYVQKDMSFAALLSAKHLPEFFLDHLKHVHTHAQLSAPVAKNGARFPLVIFDHGALGFRQHNTFQVEELVSHGYVVAAIDQPGAAVRVAFPDGRHADFDPAVLDIPRLVRDPAYGDSKFDYLGQDVSFALSKLGELDKVDPKGILTGRLDLPHTGIIGMSLGGLTAAEACRMDARIKACFIQDVFVPADVLAAGVQQPTMWFSRDGASMREEGWPKWEVDEHQNTMRQAFEGVRTDGYLVKLPGMFHVNYTDFPYLIAAPVAQRIGFTGPIDWRHGHKVVNAYTVAFFDHYLKGEPEPLLDGPSTQFPEVRFEARHHGAVPAVGAKTDTVAKP
jgi:predicted dienelactone hydrolase